MRGFGAFGLARARAIVLPAPIARAIGESSLESMKAHADKYDDLLMRERSEVVCDLPVGSDASKVRSGEVKAAPVTPAGNGVSKPERSIPRAASSQHSSP